MIKVSVEMMCLLAVGLNLTAANNVIGLDLAWSPASEAQAVDRAHRIVSNMQRPREKGLTLQGQTRPVSVKRLIVRDSVEQRILALSVERLLARAQLTIRQAGKEANDYRWGYGRR